MEKVKLFKINEGNLKCRYCGWMLTKLTKEEIKKLRLRFSFPRGVYRCDVCGELATITITVSGEDSFDEWEEKIEELPSSLQMTEKEAVDSVIQSIALLPDVSVKVECIGKALECEGLGLGCKLYYLASCGLGDSSICGDNYCKYDPYPEDYKQKFWYHADIETNIGNDIVAYWIQKLDEKSLETQKVDALKHLGSIKIREVKRFYWIVLSQINRRRFRKWQ